MEYKQIIEKIHNGLTGNSEADIQYLQAQAEEYKHHGQSREIIRAIGKMIYDCLPADKRAAFAQAVSQDEQNVQAQLEQAVSLVAQGELEQAKGLIESLINSIGALNQKDEDSEYFSFHSALEIYLYKELFQPKKAIRQTQHDNSLIYRVYGLILMELNQLDKAVAAFEQSLTWNPLDVETMFELVEVYKQTEDLDRILEIAKRSIEYVSTSGNLARCYRNLGYYYTEMEDYEAAVCFYFLSNSYEANQQATSELQYLAQKLDKPMERPDMKQVAEMLADKGVQLGANDMVIGLAMGLAKQAEAHNDKSAAKHYYGIAYDLTGDKRIKDMIDGLR
ncbi:tetratricopeptide repeat protein [Paenibacillus marinisediminis]